MTDPLAYDRDREARRHLWSGMERLSPRGRIAFLTACLQDVSHSGIRAEVTSHDGSVAEAFRDLIASAAVYGLDLYAACERLERWLRRGAAAAHRPQP